MSQPPFFVIGFQRSGTTLLRVMLDSHPDVAIPLDVTGLWWRFEARLGQFGDLQAESNRRALVNELLQEPRIKLWGVPLPVDELLAGWQMPGYPGVIDAFYSVYARHFGKRQWGDKDPGNMTQIDVLNRWFPACKLVHIVRDGRGACLSHLKQSFGHDDLMSCADAWREEVSWVRRMGSLLGAQRYHELRYEDLVANPEPILRRVCEFLGIPYADAMLQYAQRIDQSIPAEKRHIWPLIGEAPKADNADAWRQSMSEAVQVCFEKRAGTVLDELGYDTSSKPISGHYATEIGFLAGRFYRAFKARYLR